MSTPPDPHISAILLATAAKMRLLVKVRDRVFGDLGVLSDGTTEHALYVAGAGADRVAWTLEPGAGLDPHYISQETYRVLSTGALREDGAIECGGKAHRLRWRWSSSGMIAEAVPVEAAG